MKSDLRNFNPFTSTLSNFNTSTSTLANFDTFTSTLSNSIDIRLEALGKKTKTSRDMDRDVSERIALGMPVGKVADANGQFDARLFNQSAGMDAGFGADDEDTTYTTSLRYVQSNTQL